jgi:hypothetical protein
MSAEGWLVWADRTYFGAAIVAATATAITVLAGIAQNRINSHISDAKDRAFADFKVTSEVRARELENETANARLETEKIKAAVAWRSIDIGRLALAAATPPGASVTIAYIQTDPESLSLAIEIEQALIRADQLAGNPIWKLKIEPKIFASMLVWGIHITGSAADKVASIRRAFDAASIPYSADEVPNPGLVLGNGIRISPSPLETDVLILVGSKRPPF